MRRTSANRPKSKLETEAIESLENLTRVLVLWRKVCNTTDLPAHLHYACFDAARCLDAIGLTREAGLVAVRLDELKQACEEGIGIRALRDESLNLARTVRHIKTEVERAWSSDTGPSSGALPDLSRRGARVLEYLRGKTCIPTYDRATSDIQIGRATYSQGLKELEEKGYPLPPRQRRARRRKN